MAGSTLVGNRPPRSRGTLSEWGRWKRLSAKYATLAASCRALSYLSLLSCIENTLSDFPTFGTIAYSYLELRATQRLDPSAVDAFVVFEKLPSSFNSASLLAYSPNSRESIAW